MPKRDSSPVKIAVAGACGRMGRAILAVCQANPKIRIVGAWEREGHPSLGQDAGQAAGLKSLGFKLTAKALAAVAEADAVIDFSTPEATLETLKACSRFENALVLGTTGLEAAHQTAIKNYAKKAPLVQSTNFSIGVNIFWKALAQIAKVTGPEYDIEVVDIHHKMKRDAPSGTAMTTLEVLAEARGLRLSKDVVYGRKTKEGSRLPSEIGVHSLRAGDVVGDHTVYFCGPWERLEIKHQAHSRENFAAGAVRAALWLVQERKRPGQYRMAEVLGLE